MGLQVGFCWWICFENVGFSIRGLNAGPPTQDGCTSSSPSLYSSYVGCKLKKAKPLTSKVQRCKAMLYRGSNKYLLNPYGDCTTTIEHYISPFILMYFIENRADSCDCNALSHLSKHVSHHTECIRKFVFSVMNNSVLFGNALHCRLCLLFKSSNIETVVLFRKSYHTISCDGINSLKFPFLCWILQQKIDN